MPNRLATESSPYLRQHADNPVDWYPWGPEALERARREDKPILLSIGYAACHWCHVMAHESFEDEATARLMNDLFVNIKVDREERPDLDGIYMQAVQAMTGHGGWPMTMFLTPDGEPFYGGTYYPPDDRHGMPSFRRILLSVSDAFRTKRDALARTTEAVKEIYERAAAPAQSTGRVTRETLDRAFRALAGQYDERYKGFGGAPKFPPTMSLDFLLRYWSRTGNAEALRMVHETFIAMARGGMYDQIGGGFHRYSVDAQWLVPHFEKMLYDNALLVRLGAHLYQATQDVEVRDLTLQTIGWLSREMTSPHGAFYSSLDADSEGEEGKFYVWNERELDEALGADASVLKSLWDVTAGGNFEGHNILHVPAPLGVTAARSGATIEEVIAARERAVPVLLALREHRVRPGRDDKIVAAWNALMIRGLAECARVFESATARELMIRGATFLDEVLVRDGRVTRIAMEREARGPGFLEDQAATGLAFIDVHQVTGDMRWLDRAREIASEMVTWFWSDDAGAFYDTPSDAEQLVTRPRDITDNATPSGTSLAADLLLRIAEFTGDADTRRRLDWILETLAEPIARYPQAFGHALGACDMSVHGAIEVAVIGAPGHEREALLAAVADVYTPSLVLATAAPHERTDLPLLADRPLLDGRPTAYVCRGYACEQPTADASALRDQLRALLTSST